MDEDTSFTEDNGEQAPQPKSHVMNLDDYVEMRWLELESEIFCGDDYPGESGLAFELDQFHRPMVVMYAMDAPFPSTGTTIKEYRL